MEDFEDLFTVSTSARATQFGMGIGSANELTINFAPSRVGLFAAWHSAEVQIKEDLCRLRCEPAGVVTTLCHLLTPTWPFRKTQGNGGGYRFFEVKLADAIQQVNCLRFRRV